MTNFNREEFRLPYCSMRRTLNGGTATTKPPVQATKPVTKTNGTKAPRSGDLDASDDDLSHLSVKKAAFNDPTEQAEWSKKRLTWVPHEREGFVSASIQNEDDSGMVTVQVAETGQIMQISKDDCQKMNPPKFEKVNFYSGN